jgi:hypothetical protein
VLFRSNFTARKIFRTDFTEAFFEDLSKRKDGNIEHHVILNTFGETGSFKSGVNIELAKFMDDHFKVDKISFTDTEFLQSIERAPLKSFMIRDEVTSAGEFGIGSQRQNAFITVQMETLRQSEISIATISPSEKRLDTAHYILHCIGHNQFKIDNKGMALEPVYCLVGVMNPPTHNYLGSIIIQLDWMSKIWREYQVRKLSFQQMVKDRQFGKEDFSELAKKCLKNPKAKYAKKKYDWILIIQESVPSLTTEEIKMLYAQIQMLDREKKGIVNEDYTPED